MPTFGQVADYANIERALRWILSNPEPAYKNYFRDGYADYALSSQANLKFLARQIKQGRFEPTHASKVFVPKASGILRPTSLLTINDQIAYQAVVNLIAEALLPRTKSRYRTQVFQHLYAGKSSRFFYLKWQDSYRHFSRSVRANIDEGYNYVATFDLTAFYDSIDHNVLRLFLDRLRFDSETIDFLTKCLRYWTSSTWFERSAPIYIGHGVPQGPISSGILSEVILE